MLHVLRLRLALLFVCIVFSACAQNMNGSATIPSSNAGANSASLGLQQPARPRRHSAFKAKAATVTIYEYASGRRPQSIMTYQTNEELGVYFLTSQGLNKLGERPTQSDPRFGPYNANTDVSPYISNYWVTAPCVMSVPEPAPKCQPGDVMFLGLQSPNVFRPIAVAGHNEADHTPFPTRFNVFSSPTLRAWIIGGSVNATGGSQVEEVDIHKESVLVRKDLPSPHCDSPRGVYIATDIAFPFVAATPTCHRHRGVVFQINAAGQVIKTFRVPDVQSLLDPPYYGGGLWVTQQGKTNAIGVLNTSTAKLTEYRLPTPNAGPQQIVGGPGGFWFTERLASKIGVIDPYSGAITEYSTPTPKAQPWGIASYPTCPAGAPLGSLAVFFTEYKANQIGEVLITPHETLRK